MAVFKCKMCGGDLNVEEGATVCECEYCGSKQTVPTLDNEKKTAMYTRANRLRSLGDFDKASSVYESIVSEFPEEAEAYWGLVLCKYGIEYVDDPKTGNKIPTCHRSSFDCVMDDSNFDLVMEYSDPMARSVYRAEAKEIERIRSKIIEVSVKEEPYDIFICYKETDENGDRTVDSVIAQDVYDALTEKGYRVFFSRISLEDKLGEEYEPYIFAALNSAKVMLAFGTDYEYYNAPWVKNEWSRYLKLIENGEKKTLIPCFKNIDAYDMPKEFARLQAQDMGKVGAVQDLLRGVEKILGGGNASEPAQPAAQSASEPSASSSNVDALLKRVNMFLENRDWDKADEYCEKVLDKDPENGQAYAGKLLAELKIHRRADLGDFLWALDRSENYRRALRFGDDELREDLEKANQKIRTRPNPSVGLISGRSEIYAVNIDGTVLTTDIVNHENENNVFEWFDIVAVSAIDRRVVGLRADGTVVATEWDKRQWIDINAVSEWTDIVAVSTSDNHTVGLKSDGTVVAVGDNSNGCCDVSDWTDVVAVSTSGDHTVGLKPDGTVVAVGDNSKGCCDVFDWTDVVAVSTSAKHTVGLKSDGTVVAVGDNSNGCCDVSNWTDIVAVSTSAIHTVGLKSDGTVVAVGDNHDDQCNVSNWTNVVAILAVADRTVGVTRNGTILSTIMSTRLAFIGRDFTFNQMSSWKLFNDISKLSEEREEGRKKAAERREAERKRIEQEEQKRIEQEEQKRIELEQKQKQKEEAQRAAYLNEKSSLEQELSSLGRFSGKKKREITARITELDWELMRMKIDKS